MNCLLLLTLWPLYRLVNIPTMKPTKIKNFFNPPPFSILAKKSATMAWGCFCTEKANYCYETSSANHIACPYCSQANPNCLNSEPIKVTPDPEVVDLYDIPSPSPCALQLTSAVPSSFPTLSKQSKDACMKSIA